MAQEYKCSVCGENHEDFPALAFKEPDSYNCLNVEEKKLYNAQCDPDFCTIEYPEDKEFYIRVVLKQKIIDSDLTVEYGVWVSLSEKSYEDYLLNYDSEDHETLYFGWLNSAIPEYNWEESIPTDVKTKLGNERPEIIPHSDCEYQLAKDYYQGITMKEAEKRVHNMLSIISQ